MIKISGGKGFGKTSLKLFLDSIKGKEKIVKVKDSNDLKMLWKKGENTE